jgi:hypothetical protein
MKRFGVLAAAVAVAAFVNPVLAQQQRASPAMTATGMVGGAKIEINYSAPYKKGRTTWGGQLVPAGKVWRLGANEATTIKTSAPITIGTLAVPAGTHTMYLWFGEDKTAKLIVNKQTGQWGTEYNEAQDLGRVDLKAQKVDAPVEQLKIEVEPQGGGGALKITWDDQTYWAPIAAGK